MAEEHTFGQGKLMEHAEDLGKFLSSVEARLASINEERQNIAKQLREVVNKAQVMLVQLGEQIEPGRKRGRPTKPAATKTAATQNGKRRGRPKGKKVSEETKQKMRDAWARRKQQQ